MHCFLRRKGISTSPQSVRRNVQLTCPVDTDEEKTIDCQSLSKQTPTEKEDETSVVTPKSFIEWVPLHSIRCSLTFFRPSSKLGLIHSSPMIHSPANVEFMFVLTHISSSSFCLLLATFAAAAAFFFIYILMFHSGAPVQRLSFIILMHLFIAFGGERHAQQTLVRKLMVSIAHTSQRYIRNKTKPRKRWETRELHNNW